MCYMESLHYLKNNEKPIEVFTNINTIKISCSYMWNLEKWYRWSYLQSRNRGTDVENKCMDTKGERRGWEELGDWDGHIYIIDTMYKN